MLEERKNNYIMSIFKSGIYFGISICDISTGEFYSAEIKDNQNFPLLLDELARYNPSELVINTMMSESKEEISKIKEKLGIKLFSKVFRIVLTDNGSEFFNPKNIEFDLSSGNKTCNVFYCKPYSSWQKGCIEKNHEYIRKLFPKGSSFDSFSDEQIHKLENIINNIPRQSLNNKTPFDLTSQLYPDFISKLNYYKINPDDVSLNSKDF